MISDMEHNNHDVKVVVIQRIGIIQMSCIRKIWATQIWTIDDVYEVEKKIVIEQVSKEELAQTQPYDGRVYKGEYTVGEKATGEMNLKIKEV